MKDIYDEYAALVSTSKERRTEKWQEIKLGPFITKMKMCLDISCKDPEAIKKLEKFY